VNKTSIEWCARPETGGASGAYTWNPIRANFKGASRKARSGTFCTRISPGCTHCYASTINKRFGNGLEFTVPNLEQIEFFVDERILAEPLKHKKPATIFVGDMFDLFHEAIPDELIVQVFRMMCELQHRHTFQVLTKRAARMRKFFMGWNSKTRDFGPLWPYMWPQNHVWLGVSVEDNKRAIERIPQLQMTPAAVRFLSVEPQLEDVNFIVESPELGFISLLRGFDGCDPVIPGIDWVICGGESGPGARPFNLAWAESIQEQCKAADVAFFMKQIGSFPTFNEGAYPNPWDKTGRGGLRDSKGGDMSEWPAHLRVRQFPAEKLVTA
jgi:protein gp37